QGDGDAPPQGNPSAAAVVEGPDVLLEEQDEVVALLVQVNERHEKQLAFERVLQERDGFWRRRCVTLGTASSDSIDVIVDASLWRSVSGKVAYDSEKSPSPVPATELNQAKLDSDEVSTNSSAPEAAAALPTEACVSNVSKQAEGLAVEPSHRTEESEEAPQPQSSDKDDCQRLVGPQNESQEVKQPKQESNYKPQSYSYREYHNKRYFERKSQSNTLSNTRLNNQPTSSQFRDQTTDQQASTKGSDRPKSRYICQSGSQPHNKQQSNGGSYKEPYSQENDQTILPSDRGPNNRHSGKLQTQSHGHPGNCPNSQPRNRSSRHFNNQSSYHRSNQYQGKSNHDSSGQCNNEYRGRSDSKRDRHSSNQFAVRSSTYSNAQDPNRRDSQPDSQSRGQSSKPDVFSKKNIQEHPHRARRSSLPYCCQNVNESSCPSDSSPTPRGGQRQEANPYSAPKSFQSDQDHKSHSKSTSFHQSETHHLRRQDRRGIDASSDASQKPAVSWPAGTNPWRQEHTRAVPSRNPIPLKMFWEGNDMTVFRKRAS
ncbi:unnamed protein product, partial [Ixodes hexagonus]